MKQIKKRSCDQQGGTQAKHNPSNAAEHKVTGRASAQPKDWKVLRYRTTTQIQANVVHHCKQIVQICVQWCPSSRMADQCLTILPRWLFVSIFGHLGVQAVSNLLFICRLQTDAVSECWLFYLSSALQAQEARL